MTGLINKHLLLISLIVLLGLFFTTKANAATLANVSDIISTSRPSAAAPLAQDQLAATTSAAIVSLDTPILSNSPDFLASDSALLFADTGQTISVGLNVASESAQDKPLTNQQIVYFTSSIANAHHKGTTMIVPVTATHTIKFTTVTGIPASGHIIIAFPFITQTAACTPNCANIASPSATGFSFNGMTVSAPSDVRFNNATCSTVSVNSAAGTIDCALTSSVAAATTVTVLIGCTAGTTSCTTFAPRLINPTKGPTAAGLADTWKVTISTTDTSGITLDTGRALIATIEAVTVQGIVEPYLTFTIAGIAGGTPVCSASDTTNAGLTQTAEFVDLGSLTNASINIEAQNLTVNTNASAGYAITATSSGRFINPASGFWITQANNPDTALTANDTPAPGFLTAGTPAFGIHPCANSGASTTVPTISGIWGSGVTGGGAGAKYSNPWNSGAAGFYANISSTSVPSATSVTTVEYAATVSQTTPTGVYSTYFTYVATATF